MEQFEQEVNYFNIFIQEATWNNTKGTNTSKKPLSHKISFRNVRKKWQPFFKDPTVKTLLKNIIRQILKEDYVNIHSRELPKRKNIHSEREDSNHCRATDQETQLDFDMKKKERT